MVFMNHVVGLLSRPLDLATPWYGPLIVPLGFPWVWLFLILSGFLLTKQFAQGRIQLNAAGIVKFYRRRVRRLIPMLWFAPVLFGSLYYLSVWSPDLPPFLAFRELSTALVFPWTLYSPTDNPIASVNSPVWSAVLEVHYFLLLPFILWAARMSPRLIITAVVVWLLAICVLAYNVVSNGTPVIFPMIYQQHFYNCGFMLAGCALALVGKPGRSVHIAWATAPLAACILANQYLVAKDLNLALAIMPLVMLPAMIFLVSCCDSEYQLSIPADRSELKLMQGPIRWIELAGMMSYSIYLLHKPLSFIAINYLGIERSIDGLPMLALGTFETALIIFPVIIVSFVFVEVRFRRGGKSEILAPVSVRVETR
jgi:peptidoglycan/LPS O-acetylase OafA/YrhL